MREVLAHIYEQSREQLVAVASRHVAQDAEDMVQDAFVRALRRGHEFRWEAAQLTWLHRIVVNACLDHQRNARRRAALLLFCGRPQSVFSPIASDILDARRSVRNLPSAQSRVLLLYEVNGYTHREIAGLLSIPQSTSKWRLTIARRKLRCALSLPADAPRAETAIRCRP